jgi:hypothetical protein
MRQADRCTEACPRRPAAFGRRNRWRVQGFDEDRRARQPRQKGGFPRHRRDGEHFLVRKGQRCGEIASRAGSGVDSQDIQRKAAGAACNLLLPVDAVVASEPKANVETAVVPVTEVPAGKMILDVGPASVKNPTEIMLRSSSAHRR